MPRTNASAVAGIIELDPTIDLTPFIETAAAFVDQLAENSAALTPERLELIERWLAAHFYATRDPRTASEHAGPVGANYQSAVTIGLQNSHYGQVALRLDTTGTLAALDGMSRDVEAAGYWLGRDEPSGT